MIDNTITIALKPRAGKRALSGHPWIFSNEITHPKPLPPAGTIVTVVDDKSQFVGYAGYNPHSLISLRVLSRNPAVVPGTPDWFREKLARAWQVRRRLAPARRSCRLLYADSDGIPGLIVDRYEDVLAVQVLTATMEHRIEAIRAALLQEFQPRAIVLQNEVEFRKLEGLPLYTRVVHGSLDEPILIDEGGVRFLIDVREGQKTGHFFDQADNRAALTRYAAGAEVLDLFSYTGAWSLHLLRAGAARATAVDASAQALQQAQENARCNQLAERFETVPGDAFTWLTRARREKRRFDLVISDPPAFAKSVKQTNQALRGYEDLNRQAIHLVRDGGILCSCSCSYHVSEELFLQTLQRAAARERRQLRILEIRGQAQDHPILLAMPESRYLKCIIALVDPY